MLKANTVQTRHADVCTYLQGNLDAEASGCHIPADAGPDSLVFVTECGAAGDRPAARRRDSRRPA